jgi:large subunit ribosomal protein L22
MRGDTGRAVARLARLSLASVAPVSARAPPASFPAALALARAFSPAALAASASWRASPARSAAAYAATRGLAAGAETTSSDGSGTSSPDGAAGSSNTTNPSPSPLRRAPAPRASATSPSFSGTLTDTLHPTQTVRAVRREAKGSPKKFNDVCRLVRGLTVDDAVAQCALSPKKYADVVRRVILSAAANATNNHDLDREKLMVTEALVGKGTFIKRVSVHGRGRAGVITKPRSHVTVAVAEASSARDGKPKRRMKVREHEAPWKRRRRSALRSLKIAKEAGLA